MVLKKMLAIMLTGMMLTMAAGSATAQSVQNAVPNAVLDSRQDDARAARVRMDIWKLGVGERARVDVKLRDNSKSKGYIGEATDSSFTVVTKNGSNQRIAYGDVEKVKKAGGGFSTRSWIILGAAVAGTVATWIIIKPALCDGGAQHRGPC